MTRAKKSFKEQASIMKALSSEARLAIVDRLYRGECAVSELTDIVGLDQTTVSKHLLVLRSSGIVNDRREGSNVFYSLRCPCVADFFACARRVLKERK